MNHVGARLARKMRPTGQFRAGPGAGHGANWGDAKLAPEQNEPQVRCCPKTNVSMTHQLLTLSFVQVKKIEPP